MQALLDIFAPNARKLLASVVITLFAHLFISLSQLREASGTLPEVREFWLTNLVNGLPYLETDNTFLKFLTFFTVSYALVWVVSRLIDGGTSLQVLIIKKLRKT